MHGISLIGAAWRYHAVGIAVTCGGGICILIIIAASCAGMQGIAALGTARRYNGGFVIMTEFCYFTGLLCIAYRAASLLRAVCCAGRRFRLRPRAPLVPCGVGIIALVAACTARALVGGIALLGAGGCGNCADVVMSEGADCPRFLL